jgi:hypothetical protein
VSNVQQEAPGESGQRMTRPAHLLQVRATRQVRESVGTTLGEGTLERPGRFTGKINWVQIDLGKDDNDHVIDPEERLRVAMSRQ